MSKEVKYLKSPLGLLKITVKHDKLISIKYVKENGQRLTKEINSEVMKKTLIQLEEYFNHKRNHFELPLSIKGTDFQKDVYKALLKVNYGGVISYKKLAANSGHPKAYRAVGTALKKNKIPIVIPCHRVIKSDHSLGNYTGGKWRKEKLLELEGSDFI